MVLGSFWCFPATAISSNTRSFTSTWGKAGTQCGWQSAGTGCPGRSWLSLSPGCVPIPPAPGDPALLGRLDWIISRGNSVILPFFPFFMPRMTAPCPRSSLLLPCLWCPAGTAPHDLAQGCHCWGLPRNEWRLQAQHSCLNVINNIVWSVNSTVSHVAQQPSVRVSVPGSG